VLDLFDFVEAPAINPAPDGDWLPSINPDVDSVDPALEDQAAFLGRDSAGSPSWSMSQTRIMAALDKLRRQSPENGERLNEVCFAAYSKAREERVSNAESV